MALRRGGGPAPPKRTTFPTPTLAQGLPPSARRRRVRAHPAFPGPPGRATLRGREQLAPLSGGAGRSLESPRCAACDPARAPGSAPQPLRGATGQRPRSHAPRRAAWRRPARTGPPTKPAARRPRYSVVRPERHPRGSPWGIRSGKPSLGPWGAARASLRAITAMTSIFPCDLAPGGREARETLDGRFLSRWGKGAMIGPSSPRAAGAVPRQKEPSVTGTPHCLLLEGVRILDLPAAVLDPGHGAHGRSGRGRCGRWKPRGRRHDSGPRSPAPGSTAMPAPGESQQRVLVSGSKGSLGTGGSAGSMAQ